MEIRMGEVPNITYHFIEQVFANNGEMCYTHIKRSMALIGRICPDVFTDKRQGVFLNGKAVH